MVGFLAIMSVWNQIEKSLAERCRSLLTLHARAIWARFDGAHADRAETFVLVSESDEGEVTIRLEDRCMLAEALRDSGNASADEIDFIDLPRDAIMVMIMPSGNMGALVVPFSRGPLDVNGSA